MQLIVRQKDIFTEPDHIPIAHVVAADDNLAAGFAKEIKHQYPKYAYEFFAKKIIKEIFDDTDLTIIIDKL